MNDKNNLRSVLTKLAVILAVLFFLPALINAGDLEPPGPPGRTMKPLDELPPTWSQILHPSVRFKVLEEPCFTTLCPSPAPIWGVLDKETGLVWEYAPSTTQDSWGGARNYCFNLKVGGRKGWRLPTIEELTSLIDTTQVTNIDPALPIGHPFLNVQTQAYWSITTQGGAAGGAQAYQMIMYNGFVSSAPPKTDQNYIWCVRGGHGFDGY